VNHFPFPVFYDTLFYDSEGEEVNEPLEEKGPSFYYEGEKMIKETRLGDDVPFHLMKTSKPLNLLHNKK
jgi:hypothetical protein